MMKTLYKGLKDKFITKKQYEDEMDNLQYLRGGRIHGVWLDMQRTSRAIAFTELGQRARIGPGSYMSEAHDWQTWINNPNTTGDEIREAFTSQVNKTTRLLAEHKALPAKMKILIDNMKVPG